MNPSDVKRIRKRLGITQSRLSKESSVSQSLIAKIEAGSIDPSFSSVESIFSAFERLSKKNMPSAKDMMRKKLITVDEGKKVSEAIKLMKKHNISQVPVVKDGMITGVISESTILNSFIEGKEGLVVRDVMKDAPPIIAKDTSMDVISSLLRYFQLVIIAEKGKPKGIITKADLIENIY
ncbi:MAG: CBS domain-containing protein [Nanobdellota archaeon]